MFQNSLPAVSNRFQSASSTTSMCKRFMASVILRVPPSKTCCSLAAALVRQQAHNGSSPCADRGATTSALLAWARSARYVSHSRVRNGMSHPTIKFHSAPPPVSLVICSAVMIPASGPWPSQRSAMQVTPSGAYLRGAAITFTCFVMPPSSDRIRKSIGAPPISTSALSRPKRVLPPPANTYPDTSFVSVPSPPTLRLCLILLFFFNRLSPRTPNSNFPQFFLQALAMQTDRRRGSRNIPPMIPELLRQIRHLELALGLSKVPLAQPIVAPFSGRLLHQRLAARHFLRQLRDADLFPAAQHQAALQRILQLAHISRPVVTINRRHSLARQARRASEARS